MRPSYVRLLAPPLSVRDPPRHASQLSLGRSFPSAVFDWLHINDVTFYAEMWVFGLRSSRRTAPAGSGNTAPPLKMGPSVFVGDFFMETGICPKPSSFFEGIYIRMVDNIHKNQQKWAKQELECFNGWSFLWLSACRSTRVQMPDVLLCLSDFTLMRTLETAELWGSFQGSPKGTERAVLNMHSMLCACGPILGGLDHSDSTLSFSFFFKTAALMGDKNKTKIKRISQENCFEFSLAPPTGEEEEKWARVSHLCGRGFPLSLLCGLHRLPLQLLPKLEQSLQLSAFGNYSGEHLQPPSFSFLCFVIWSHFCLTSRGKFYDWWQKSWVRTNRVTFILSVAVIVSLLLADVPVFPLPSQQVESVGIFSGSGFAGAGPLKVPQSVLRKGDFI